MNNTLSNIDMDALATSAKTSEEDFETIYSEGSRNTLIASNPSTPARILIELSVNNNAAMQKALLKNKNLPEEAWVNLVNESSDKIFDAIIRHKNLPTSVYGNVVRKLNNKDNIVFFSEKAKTNLSAQEYNNLMPLFALHTENDSAQRVVVENPESTEECLITVYDTAVSVWTKFLILSHPNCGENIFRKAFDKDSNKLLPRKAYEVISDKDEYKTLPMEWVESHFGFSASELEVK